MIAAQPRKRVIPLIVFMLCVSALPVPIITSLAVAGPAQPPASGLFDLPERLQAADPSDEVADLLTAPIDNSMSGSDVMRSRPLILDWNNNPAFALTGGRDLPFSVDEARAELDRLLGLRQLDPVARSGALALFDDQRVVNIVSSPVLRASLLMLYDSDPYQAVVDSILSGANDSGRPFSAVEFTSLNHEGAVATIVYDQSSSPPAYRLQIAADFANETPLQLAPVIIHESLHGDGLNSSEEELTANILDTIAYGELLLLDAGGAYVATELAAYNNIQLYALLNSMGARGGGHAGITTSVSGDVFVGPGLEDFDAGSVRDSILQDAFYGSLESGETTIPPTASKLIQRFSGHETLGERPVYGEELLALIDREVSAVITPQRARELAVILGLSVTLGSAEPAGLTFTGSQFSLQSRPYAPLLVDIFDLNRAGQTPSPSGVDSIRAELELLLAKQPGPFAIREQAFELFDMPLAMSTVPDPQLRAALVLMWALSPWTETARSFLTPAPQTQGWTFSFEHLPLPVNAQHVRDQDGRSVVLVNELLSGDSLEVISAALLEGILLEEDRRSPNGAVVAALMSTLAYAELVTINPEVVATPTWGTISRNRDLLALINSSRWTAGSQPSNSELVGFLAPANGAADVLPGLVYDATSFQSYVLKSPRADGAEQMSIAVASELFIRLAGVTGIPIAAGPGGIVITGETMSIIDSNLGEFMTSDDVQSLTVALFLGIPAPQKRT